MLNDERGLCQRKPCKFLLIFGLLIHGSCSRRPIHNDLPPVDAVPVWFKMDPRFSPKNSKEEITPHPFFDLAPFASAKDRSLNFYPLTPEDSKVLYDLDLLSGKKFLRAELCPQKDVWEKYDKKITYPSFTEGIVPRMLDVAGLPQRILVFGMGKFYQSLTPEDMRSFRVRVVGGMVLQYCSYYPCNNALRPWNSRPYLLAVDLEDSKYRSVFDIDDLKKEVDFNYLEAYLQNAYGRTLLGHGKEEGHKELPAYRVLRPISSAKALGFVMKNDHIFSFLELKSLRQQCLKLYDHVWESTSKIRYFKKNPEQLRKQNLSAAAKIAEQNSTVVTNETYTKEIEAIGTADFKKFLSTFQKKYRTEYNLCIKYVAPANINENPKRLWFFSMLQSFFELDRLGYVYDCGRNSWITNPYNLNKTRTFDFAVKLNSCSLGQLERGIEKAPAYLQGLFSSNLEHLRFIEYDNQPLGTHQKIYSWVNFNGKRVACENKKQNELMAVKKNKIEVFPNDVRWESFYIEETDGLIIRKAKTAQ